MNTCETGNTKQRSYSGDYMQVGKAGEKIVIDYLRQSPSIIGVKDWSEVKEVQEADIDCAIKTIDGNILLAEIKTDNYLGATGNILFEILRINHTCDPQYSLTLGWSGRTPANYIIYYGPNINQMYVFKTSDLRRAMQKYTAENRKQSKISIVETDNIKTTLNILIPIKYCDGFYRKIDLNTAEDFLP